MFAIFELKSQELQAQLDLFKAAQVFHPVCVRCGATPSAVDVRSRAAQIPCLNSETTITALVDELPRYLLEVNGADVSPDVKEANAFDDEVWWHSHREKLPHWHAAATKLFLHMPSSASVERVFSVLKNIIGDQQSNGLKDLVEGTMLINFNQRQRAAGR